VDDKKRLLIIDDERDICEVLKAKFQFYGFEVFVAYDGREGFEKVTEVNPHCILLDIRMPGEDGLTFLRHLRSYRDDDPETQARIRKIPIIVLTATGGNMKSLFQTEGVSDFVEKPFDANNLRDRIFKVIGNPQA